MDAALHIKTRVLPGQKIEVTAPELVEGEPVEVIVVFPGPGRRGRRSVMDIIESGTLPRTGRSAEEVDRYIREERDSWDR